jgi:hypothetical protein
MTHNGFSLPTRDFTESELEVETGFAWGNIGKMRRAMMQSLVMDYKICHSLSNGKPATFEIDVLDAPVLAAQIRQRKKRK